LRRTLVQQQIIEQMGNNSYEISLIKIKEGRADFVADVFRYADEWVNENDDWEDEDVKAYVRNAPDGCYEVFVVVTEKEEQ
jgi:hypothetical protein